jgi:hypothetical protein
VKMPFIKRFAKDPKVHGSRDVRPISGSRAKCNRMTFN